MKPGSAVQHNCLRARPQDQCDGVNNPGEYLKAVIHKSALQHRDILLPCYMSSQTNSWKFCEEYYKQQFNKTRGQKTSMGCACFVCN